VHAFSVGVKSENGEILYSGAPVPMKNEGSSAVEKEKKIK
jgi:hypothetical protein